ncbi:copper oxidase [Legionella jamestowniensis]|uniref:Copper oxidase n=1 Tax=Legionella jamestowniensis TaxID=455 RepID=A0ABX2XTR0_9GAMM|nr:multicopper oxidase family protein [Legionella jamestowniensis]OCH98003.1 copper oxidase [Legionella jamestowniensis]
MNRLWKACACSVACISTLLFYPLATFAKPATSLSESSQTVIEVSDKQFQLNEKSKATKAFELLFINPDGSTTKEGYFGTKGELFNVLVVNKTAEPITIHWHGLILPNPQDGVPGVTQTPIKPGESRPYQYKLVQSGTYWMHSHEGFQEQQQLSAPFIIYDSDKKNHDTEEVIMFLEDFTYQNPWKLFKTLRNAKVPVEKISKPNDKNRQSTMSMKMDTDYNDIDYDAFLTNKTTLENPQVKPVTAGQTVRLRIINASTSTNYEINLGKLKGSLIAVDGERVKPIDGSQFPIGIGNRLDILVRVPNEGGVFPILAQAEGTNKQTGLIIATVNQPIPKFSSIASETSGRIPYYELEKQLQSLNPLPNKKGDISLNYTLQGSMQGYRWTMNNESWPHVIPLIITKGQRVEMIFTNKNTMSHPMHLHGHVFHVTEVDGVKLTNGAMRDTVLVQPDSTIKIQFDADNPGIWLMHCHNLYHFMGGMGTTIEYANYPRPLFYLETIGQATKK